MKVESGSFHEVDQELVPGHLKSLRWSEPNLRLGGFTTTEWRFMFPRYRKDPVHLRIGSDDLEGWETWAFVTPDDDELVLREISEDVLKLVVDADITQDELDNHGVLVRIPLVITNADSMTDASLDFRLRILNAEGDTTFLAYPEQLSSLPVHVTRMDDAKLELTFKVLQSVVRQAIDLERYRWFPKEQLRLYITDRVTGRKLNLRLPARYHFKQ
jgi:hypothetical protein